MPYIHVQVTREGVTRRQKQALITGITRLMTGVLGKDPRTTHVVITEIPTDNWGHDGRTVTEHRKARRTSHPKP